MTLGRREFLRGSVAGAIVGLSPQKDIESSRPHLQAQLSPENAIRELLAGNQRFVANRLTSIEYDLAMMKQHTIDKQTPFAAVLACADSRVLVELLFDQPIGRLFVTRVAGNVVSPEIIASLEYGVAVLGVGAVVVLGHTNCGAVSAAMKSEDVPGQISVLYKHLQPAVEGAAGNVQQAIERNAMIQAGLLRSSSTVISQALKSDKLRVASGVYDLATGVVHLI